MFQIESKSWRLIVMALIESFLDFLNDSIRDFSLAFKASSTCKYFEVNRVSLVDNLKKSWDAFSNLLFMSLILRDVSLIYFRLIKKGEISSSIFLASKKSNYSLTKISFVNDLIFSVSFIALLYSLSLENNLDLINSLTSFSYTLRFDIISYIRFNMVS